MRRATVSLFALGALLNGCVIYDTERVVEPDDDRCWDRDDCDSRDDDDPDRPGADDPADTDTGDTPDPEPQIEMWLSVATAAQGDSLLTWLETEDPFDFTTVQDVVFVGDVTVTDRVLRPDEAFLLLEVAPDAELGVVQVFVEFTDGTAVLIPGGFTVTEAPAGTDPCAR